VQVNLLFFLTQHWNLNVFVAYLMPETRNSKFVGFQVMCYFVHYNLESKFLPGSQNTRVI
jgi:hypothetical protein